ncbi:unnamed protein product [Candidula unifasciata]|uniref:Cyanocobalamin reductase (cyanide-eliminating) n=1 Tax=Candidula unifasciata TaxID=100452 RepID=A0A8S3YGF8_9EUPU|nr:unnamed protein product [Candidula unifasciata]
MADFGIGAMAVSSSRLQEITTKLNSLFTPLGMEVHPFKIRWYNEHVSTAYQFDLHPDTRAYVVISTPDMFEKALLPFICSNDHIGSMDVLDRCMQFYFGLVKKEFPDEDVEIIHDFEMTPMRRAKVLVQPACHVAGAAYYYTRKDLNSDPFEDKNIFGVCIHPKYGGWFAIRGIIIFKSVLCPNLQQTEPVDCVPQQEDRVKLLDLFTNHWKDWRYRDIIPVKKRIASTA